jgi:hypothetical protein
VTYYVEGKLSPKDQEGQMHRPHTARERPTQARDPCPRDPSETAWDAKKMTNSLRDRELDQLLLPDSEALREIV